MTTVATRVRKISEIEDFDIVVIRDGVPVDVRSNGVMRDYPYINRSVGDITVAQWRDRRFHPNYHGLTCQVLYEDGTVAPGQTLLRTVRESYETAD